MGGRESETGEPPREQRREPADRTYLLVATGWILVVVGLVWMWMVFFAHQDEIGLWIAAAICGLGYLLQRSATRHS